MENNSDTDYEDRDYDLWLLFAHTRRAMFNARKKELSQFGITVEQSAILIGVYALGDMATASKLSRCLYREPHSISEHITRMEKKGLLRRVKHPHITNQVEVKLTEKGLNAYRKSAERKSIHNIISALSEEEQQQLRSCLGKLRETALRLSG